jgi:ABC-2 type transport system permease protein
VIALLIGPLRAVRRATVWWSVGLAALVGVTVAFWPAFQGSSGISEAIDQLPQGVVQALGLANFGTPAGFLRGNLYEFIVPLLLAIAAVALVNGQTASEEASGRLELFLAQPVGRGAVFLGRAAAALGAVVVISAVSLVVQLVAERIVNLQIDDGSVLATVVLCGLLAVLHGSVAFAIAAATGKPGLVLAVGVAAAVGGYLVNALLPLSATLAPWHRLSAWAWALDGNPLENPTEPWRYVALVLPSIALLLIGTLLVRRRDVSAA